MAEFVATAGARRLWAAQVSPRARLRPSECLPGSWAEEGRAGEPQPGCFQDRILAGEGRGVGLLPHGQRQSTVELLPGHASRSLLGSDGLFLGGSPLLRGIRQVGRLCSLWHLPWQAVRYLTSCLLVGGCGRSWRPPRLLCLLSRRTTCQLHPPPNSPKGCFPFFSEVVCGGGPILPPPFVSASVGVPAEYPECFVNGGRAWGTGALAFSVCASKAFHVPPPPLGNSGVCGDCRAKASRLHGA